jgi:hypothetical protein
MHPQLEIIAAEFHQAQDLLAELARAPVAHWIARPSPTAWSAAECVAHLNLTSRAVLPRIRIGLQEARAIAEAPPRRYRRDPLGWLLWRTMGPPVRFRIKTAASFVPESTSALEVLIAEFGRLQREQIACVEEADGLPIARVRVKSPFDERVRYNLYACLTILPRHQLRHLWQAGLALRERDEDSR